MVRVNALAFSMSWSVTIGARPVISANCWFVRSMTAARSRPERPKASYRIVSRSAALPAAVSAAGALDPNWALAPGLEDAFRYPQYNFYFYHIAAHGLIRAAHALGGA